MVQRILVVDDNRELQKLVRNALEHEGYDVLTACHNEVVLIKYLDPVSKSAN